MRPEPIARLARMDALERRYDVLPPWAWRRSALAAERLEATVGAIERLIRESDRAVAENLARIERLNDRHRRNKSAFLRALARHRAVLAALDRGVSTLTGR